MDASLLFVQNFGKKYEELPVEVVEEVKKQILDYIGVAIAGAAKDGVNQVRELITEWGGQPQATIIGTGAKVPAPNAAQVNATLAHSLDYDDVHEAAIMHPGVVSIPTSLAVSEYMGGKSGRDFIQAVAIGGDMISRMGLATRPGKNIHPYGWHFTTLNGGMTAAAIAGKLMGLTEQQMVYAIGIAYHQACGNGQAVSDGALTKRLGPGFSVRNGIMSAMLAARGVTGSVNTLEGEKGYYAVYHRGENGKGDYSREILVGDLGKRYESVNISIKPYPCCRGTHPGVDAALQLAEEHDIKPEEIEKIHLYVGEGTFGLLCDPIENKAHPRSQVDCQFSVPWGVATGLTKRRASLQDYTEEAIKDERVLATASKISVSVDHTLDKGGLEPARLEITMKNGEVYTKQINEATGSPGNPITFDGCERKFRDCIAQSVRPVPQENIEAIVKYVKNLENESDIRDLMKLLVW